MKKVLIVAIILVQTFLYNACNNNKENKNAKESTVQIKQLDVDEEGKNFMEAASQSSIMQVEFGKLAEQKGSTPAVKEFAYMMINYHTKTYNEMKKMATDKHILLPIEMNQDQTLQLGKLQNRQGSAFDENYIRMMIYGQQKAVKDFQSGASNRDRDVNKFASEKIPELKKHLNSSRSIFNNLIINRQ